ncbi:bacterioferritin-associated ferredoxin [Metabacillus crassostreae]|uniref:PCYCGC motif-containing (lipo)protein n=1 Tax=Metabacillus crassostreae TaxID=929098 RepID=UPI00195C0F70|nr:bacterioferritin-associated ferredoxin [Metabacillus crassostreae]
MNYKKKVIVVFTAVAIVSGCSNTSGSNDTNEHTDHAEHQDHVINDIREETTGIDILPTFLNDKPENMQVIYQAASQHKDLLEKIPCYCGCGESANHKSSYDCFVFENKEDGNIIWDDHGTKCGVCLEIAAQSIVDFQEGKSVKDIRSKIDEMYKEGYSTPTPTPEV